tara:strand:+ start:29097 stop:29888 length:792 start_codon:yes stop_codon:yes gene_type:complete
MKVYYSKNKKSLVYISKKATPDFWDEQWNADLKNLDKLYKNDSYVSKITSKYLPKNSVVVEGGCGRANHVYALKKNGYNAIGIDFAPETVSFVNKHFTELDVRLGDVMQLDLESQSVDAYWSLGVIEHFFSGYKEIAEETNRILKKKGYIFLTFPSMNILRKIKAKLGLYPIYNDLDKEYFYQFALDPDQVISQFKDLDFDLISKKRTNGFKGLKDESPKFLKPIFQRIYDSDLIFSKLFSLFISKTMSFFCGHSIILILRKK